MRLVLEAAALPALAGALEAARAGVRTGGDPRNREFATRPSRPTALPEELLALGYDAADGGRSARLAPGRQGAVARGRVPRAATSSSRASARPGLESEALSGSVSARRDGGARSRALGGIGFRRRYRRVAVADGGDARRLIVATRRDRAAHRLGPRLPALADLHARTRSRRATTRTSSSRTASSRRSPSSRRSRSRSPPGGRPVSAARGRWLASARLRRDARAGAARRDHRPLRPQSVPRHLAPSALARRARLGVLALLEATRLVARRARRAPGARAPGGARAPVAVACSSSPGRLRPRPGRFPGSSGTQVVPRLGTSTPRCTGTCARSRCSGSSSSCSPPGRGCVAALPVAPARLRRPPRDPARADGARRAPVPHVRHGAVVGRRAPRRARRRARSAGRSGWSRGSGGRSAD